MLAYNLTPIFKVRGIENPHSFLVKNGFSSHTAHNISTHQTRIFRLDHVERLCKILICEPNDLLMWIPDKNEPIAENHPLQKLTIKQSDLSIHEELNMISYKELKEISQKIISAKDK